MVHILGTVDSERKAKEDVVTSASAVCLGSFGRELPLPAHGKWALPFWRGIGVYNPP